MLKISTKNTKRKPKRRRNPGKQRIYTSSSIGNNPNKKRKTRKIKVNRLFEWIRNSKRTLNDNWKEAKNYEYVRILLSLENKFSSNLDDRGHSYIPYKRFIL